MSNIYCFNTENQCRDCNDKHLYEILNLGIQPLANALRSDLNIEELKVPLKLCRCENCGTIQLNVTVNPEILFNNYLWTTGTSKTAKIFSDNFCKKLISRLDKKKNFIVEIASNDGTFLQPLLEAGQEVLGVEPAKNIADMATNNGVPTLNKFFSKKVAEKIVADYGKADCVFARNVIPHVANAKDVIAGIGHCLNDSAIGAIEFHRADIILKELHYDSIYHEHLYYHSLSSMERLLKSFNLYSFDVEESPISGGSYIVYFSKQQLSETIEYKKAINEEIDVGVTKSNKWLDFAKNVELHRDNLKQIIHELKNKNMNIYGWGASARSSTLLNYCNLTSLDISAIFDKSYLKHNLYTPGSNIPIVNPEKIKLLNPDVIIILAWNFYDEIIDELKLKFKWNGLVIKPLPNLTQLIQIK